MGCWIWFIILLQDIDVDKKLDFTQFLQNLVHKNYAYIKSFHALTVLFWLLFAIASDSSYFAFIAVIVSAIMLSYEHYLVNKDFRKIDKAFLL